MIDTIFQPKSVFSHQSEAFLEDRRCGHDSGGCEEHSWSSGRRGWLQLRGTRRAPVGPGVAETRRATGSMRQEATAGPSWQTVVIPERLGQWVTDADFRGIRSRTLTLTLGEAEHQRSLAHSSGPTFIDRLTR